MRDPHSFDICSAHARGRGAREDRIERYEVRHADHIFDDARGLCCGTGSTTKVEELGEKHGRTIQGNC